MAVVFHFCDYNGRLLWSCLVNCRADIEAVRQAAVFPFLVSMWSRNELLITHLNFDDNPMLDM